MNKSIGRVLAGVGLVAIAVVIVMSSFGIGFELPADIQVWQWVVGVFLLIGLVDSIRRLEFVEVFLMLGFEVMVFEPQLGVAFGFADKNWISNWLVFFVSFLLGVGFSMIFKGFSLFKVRVKKNTLGHSVKYIDCTDFKKETVYNKMGELEVRFENACVLSNDATLTVHNSLGQTDVYVPATWRVRVNRVNSLGEIVVDKILSEEGDGEYMLTVNAYNKLGEIDIKAL